MFGDDFFLDVKQPKNSANSDKPACPTSPPQSCEEWMFRERIKQWPFLTSKNAEDLGLKPEDVLGSLQDIEEDLLIHSRAYSRYG